MPPKVDGGHLVGPHPRDGSGESLGLPSTTLSPERATKSRAASHDKPARDSESTLLPLLPSILIREDGNMDDLNWQPIETCPCVLYEMYFVWAPGYSRPSWLMWKDNRRFSTNETVMKDNDLVPLYFGDPDESDDCIQNGMLLIAERGANPLGRC